MVKLPTEQGDEVDEDTDIVGEESLGLPGARDKDTKPREKGEDKAADHAVPAERFVSPFSPRETREEKRTRSREATWSDREAHRDASLVL